jgi:hypothetical protein
VIYSSTSGPYITKKYWASVMRLFHAEARGNFLELEPCRLAFVYELTGGVGKGSLKYFPLLFLR